MARVIDEMGNRYGKLVVIERIENSKTGQAVWRCKCDCGEETIVFAQNLRRGATRSCGCSRTDYIANLTLVQRRARAHRLPFGEASFRKALRSMKASARARGYQWGLSDEEARTLMDSLCYYCGSKPCGIVKNEFENGDYYHNGIDRVDNSKGYLLANVVPCCADCNKAKGARDYTYFIAWLKRIAVFQGEKDALLNS